MASPSRQLKLTDLFSRVGKRAADTLTAPTSGEPLAKATKLGDEENDENRAPADDMIPANKSNVEDRQEPTDKTKWLGNLLVDKGWRALMKDQLEVDYFKQIQHKLDLEHLRGKTVFPPRAKIFAAFNETPFARVKVVIIGQDPYHNDGQAEGLSFSVPRGQPPPPSLINIYKELGKDINGFRKPDHGCLLAWARQGVLLLNASLTVRAHEANSHKDLGWQEFTDCAIKRLSKQAPKGIVFVLWGNFAQKKEALIDKSRHCIIKTGHPSPLSVRFFEDKRCFKRIDEALKKLGHSPMDWSL